MYIHVRMLLKIIGMEETAIKDNNYYKKFLENYLNDKKLNFDIKAYLPDFLDDLSASGQTHKSSYEDSDSENDEDEVLTHKFQEIKLTYVDSGNLLNYFYFLIIIRLILMFIAINFFEMILFQMMKMKILLCQLTTNGILLNTSWSSEP